MEYTKTINTKDYTININVDGDYGYFEHNELGEDSAGGLWFNNDELVDYDGVYALPVQVYDALRASYLVDNSFNPND